MLNSNKNLFKYVLTFIYIYIQYIVYREVKMVENKRKNQKAIMVYVPEIVHDAVKEAVNKQGMTVTSYVLRALVHKLNLERTEKIKY